MLGLGHDNLHSSLVAWAKILLPLAALAVLSTLFMVSRPITPEDAIPYADVDLEDRLRDPRLTGPAFAGMTEDGTAITLQATEATPGVAGTTAAGQALGLGGRIETPDGVETRFSAAKATLDEAAQVVNLTGGVAVDSTAGYHIATGTLSLWLDRTRLDSNGPVTAESPFGTLSAGRMMLIRTEDGRYKLDFTQGVHLIYQPRTPG